MMPVISAETDRLSSEAHKQLVFPALPALRGLAKLADLRPVIVIDCREQEPLTFARLGSVRDTLYSGDYSIRGLEGKFAVERKNLDDIANCCLAANRSRFEHELHRLRGFCFTRLLIIGTREDVAAGRYHSKIIPNAVLAALDAFEIRYSIPLVFCESPAEAALAIERWVWRFARQVVTDANNLLRGSSLAKERLGPTPTEVKSKVQNALEDL